MKTSKPGLRVSAIAALSGLAMALCVPSAFAQDRGQEEGPGLALRISDRVAEKHNEAFELYFDERYDEALKVLGRLRMRSMNARERARTHHIMAYVYNGKDELEKAAERLQLAFDEGVYEGEEKQSLLFELVQVQSQLGRWEKVVENLGLWFQLEDEPGPEAYYMLAVAYWELEQLDKAVEPARKAVEMTDDPQQGWLQLLLALRLTRREYEEAVPLLEKLASRYPKKTWFVQLSTVHGALGHYEESLVPLQLAYIKGYLDTDEDYRKLGQLLLFLDLPYRAAQVLDEGLREGIVEKDRKALEMLGNSRIAAKEYESAVPPLEEAAQLAETGELSVRLAQVYLQRDEWSRAIEALERALEKGVEEEGQTKLLLGIAHYSNDDRAQAMTWFSRASEHERSRAQASVWLGFIQNEIDARSSG